MKKTFFHRGAIAVVIASLLWSVDGLLRVSLYTLPPAVVVFWEHLLGFIILLPFIITMWRGFKKLSRRQWAAITFVALLSGAAGTILYTAALGQVQYIPFSVVVLLQQLNPIFAIVAAALLLKERLSKQFLGLTAVALIGAYMVSFPSLVVNFETGKGTLIAALFAVGAAASWGIATAFSKYALKGTSYIHITAARFGITPLFALLFVGILGNGSSLTALTMSQFGTLLAITFSTGMVALLVYYYGLQKIEASHAATLELAWPLSSVLVGWLFLQQGLTPTQMLGALLLLFATYTIGRATTDQSNSQKVAEQLPHPR